MEQNPTRQAILAKANGHDLFVSPSVMPLLEARFDFELFLEKMIIVAKDKKAMSLNVSIFNQVLEEFERLKGEASKVEEAANVENLAEKNGDLKVEVLRTDYKPVSRDIESDLQISIRDSDVTGKSRCKGKVEDFVTYFNDRFSKMKKILRQVSANDNPLKSIREAKAAKGQSKIIAIVNEKRPTKNGHLIIEVEDEEEYTVVLVGKDSPLMEEAQNTYLDEIIAIDVFNNGNLLIAKNFTKPGRILQEQTRKKGELDVSVAFMSDLHVGSRFFEKEKFENFIAFLNGKSASEGDKLLAGNIKYLAVAGDCSDGIGIYPSQEKELVIKDIYKQYEVMFDYLKQIPDYIEIIVTPGNHDAVRGGDPQPQLTDDLAKWAKGFKNIHLAGSPSVHKIHNFDLLMYHGTSSDALISNNIALKDGYLFPQKIGIEMLRRRHLMPIYGEDPMIPENKDYLLIDEKPDIFHFGHVHKNGYAVFQGTQIINSGTWQGQTDFQVKHGHIPTPGLLPIYNLKTLELTSKQF